jgi:hypothetical protein
MQLSHDDASLFFKLMPALQTFANQRLKIIEGMESVEQYQKISNVQRVKLRNALYKKPELIDEFVGKNPFGFSSDELAVVGSWKNFISGEFFIERVTKKYVIFIGENKVYGVLALTQPFEVVLGGQPLPVYVKTVLLPFKGKIVYDGLIEGHNIIFGGGMASSFKNTYRAAKQQGKIIESLDPGWKPSKPKVHAEKDWKPILDELLEKSTKLRGSGNSPAIYGPAFSLVKASLEFARTAVEFPNDLDKLDKALDKVMRTSNKAEKTMYFMDFQF